LPNISFLAIEKPIIIGENIVVDFKAIASRKTVFDGKLFF